MCAYFILLTEASYFSIMTPVGKIFYFRRDATIRQLLDILIICSRADIFYGCSKLTGMEYKCRRKEKRDKSTREIKEGERGVRDEDTK
jgi:hypothetical protein